MEESVRMLIGSRKDLKPLTIVITGCNSGIGLQACKLLRLVSPKSRLFLVARNREKALQIVDELNAVFPGYENISNDNCNNNDNNNNNSTISQQHHARKTLYPMVCDHTSFSSVRNFCEEMKEELDVLAEKEGHHIGIDVMCLNAAILLGEDAEAQFTEDNLELTIQTNYFSPFLIVNNLFDCINVGARVVVTSSGLHAFESFGNFEGVIDPKNNSGKINDGFEMICGTPFDHKKSYAASKLCVVAFCRELDRRLRERNAKAICFTPGLITTSGLFKHQKQWNETVLKKVGMGMVDTKEWGGCILAWTVISDKAAQCGGCYWRASFGISQRDGKIPDDLFSAPINEEATDRKNQETLWKISSALTGTSLKQS